MTELSDLNNELILFLEKRNLGLNPIIQKYREVQKISVKAHEIFENIPKDKIYENQLVLFAYTIFNRIYLYSENINDVIHHNQNSKNWDYKILFLITRSLIESVETLFHLCLDDVPLELKLFRISCIKLHEYKDTKNYYEMVKSLANLPEETKLLSLLGEKLEEAKNELDSQATKNYIFMTLNKKNQESVLSGGYKLYHPDFSEDSRVRYSIESKMGIDKDKQLKKYKLSYFLFSFGVHPYNTCADPVFNIKADPELVQKMTKSHALSALDYCVSYLGFSTRQIIDKVLLTEMKDELSENIINELDLELSKLKS